MGGNLMACRQQINQAETQSLIPKRFILHGASQHAACINWLKFYQGKKIEVNITEYISDHTESQRGYFHVLCKIFADAVGESPDAIKWIAKKETFGSEEKKIAGVHIEVIQSTAKGSTNKIEYIDLIETLMRLAAFADVYLPPPRDY